MCKEGRGDNSGGETETWQRERRMLMGMQRGAEGGLAKRRETREGDVMLLKGCGKTRGMQGDNRLIGPRKDRVEVRRRSWFIETRLRGKEAAAVCVMRARMWSGGPFTVQSVHGDFSMNSH